MNNKHAGRTTRFLNFVFVIACLWLKQIFIITHNEDKIIDIYAAG